MKKLLCKHQNKLTILIGILYGVTFLSMTPLVEAGYVNPYLGLVITVILAIPMLVILLRIMYDGIVCAIQSDKENKCE